VRIQLVTSFINPFSSAGTSGVKDGALDTDTTACGRAGFVTWDLAEASRNEKGKLLDFHCSKSW